MTPHPAKFSSPILDLIDSILPVDARVLDPFAGVGLIHNLCRQSVAIELEHEWAGDAHSTVEGMGQATIVANALQLPFRDGSWPWVVTSPTYGNRMADHHDAQERCKPCRGTGIDRDWLDAQDPNLPLNGNARPAEEHPCPRCDGLGYRTYKRLTYRHQLGRELHPDNSGRLQWGPKYQAFHARAWAEVWRVMEPRSFEEDGGFILNAKDHVRGHEVAPVVAWHRETLLRLGFELTAWHEVETQGMGFGANRDARVPFEVVAVYIKPT